MYRTHVPTTPRAPADPLASEMLQVRQQQHQNREKLITIQNRIRLLQEQEQAAAQSDRRLRQRAAFHSLVRERREQDVQIRERVRAQRQAEELEARIHHLQVKQQRAKQLSTLRARILAERRETVESIRLVSEQLDAECERRQEQERQRNIERRKAVVSEETEVRTFRAASVQGHRVSLKQQYRQRLEFEKQKAEAEARRLQELERLENELAERVHSKSVNQPL